MKIEIFTIIYQPPRILLGVKKNGFGKMEYNGFGGRIEYGESLEECAVRKTFEEVGIKIKNPEKIGRILFQSEINEPDYLIHFFIANEFEGIPKESDEIRTEWFEEENIPYEKMLPGGRYWLPLLLKRKKFRGKINFGDRHKVIDCCLEEII